MASLFQLKLFSVIVFYTLGSFSFSPTKTASTFNHYNCTNKPKFGSKITYQFNQNRKKLLSTLTLESRKTNHGFYNTTIFGRRNKRDIVYGLFMCNGYTEKCRECVTKSIRTLKSMCSSSKEAIIWTDECMIRYSNRFFFNTMEEFPSWCMKNNEDYQGQLVSFNKVLSSLMEDLLTQISEASMGSNIKFALNKTTISEDKHLFGFAQCIPYLSKDYCSKCLGDAMDYLQTSCARGKMGGAVLYPNCIVRYDHNPFFTLPIGKRKNTSPGALATIIFYHALVPVVIFSFGCCVIHMVSRKYLKGQKRKCLGEEEITTELKSLQVNLSTIQKATNKFSGDNKIGEGGFGVVYKGVLPNGNEIAAKRLKRNSNQGATEFKKEVLLISKFRHRNLVRLLGFCTEKSEKILIYEFVHNKSLDYYLFSLENHRILNWSERYKIIKGIARGILYLHEDSHLNIVHCDLKPSNILLDKLMTAKISDFGLARIISMDQMQGNTSMISGTYGYMSPEYAMRGQFSNKSDVFSLGVIILEIISGKRNVEYCNGVDFDDLLSHVWKSWRGTKPLEIVDPTLEHSFSESEITRCIQISLLCVQGKPDQRPSMSRIVSYLNCDPVELPLPQEQAYISCVEKQRSNKSDKELKFN